MADIYNHYIRHSVITFEEELISATEMQQRLNRVRGRELPWLVLEQENEVVGYAYACPWRERAAYLYSVELSVYLHYLHSGKGLGSLLFSALLDELTKCDVNAVIGGIALPNPASIALHEKFGLEKVAHFNQVGFKLGRWIDVGYWQKCLQT